MDTLKHTKDATFENDVLQSPMPVVVDFYADWCRPCDIIAPYMERLAREFEGKINVYKLNVDENPRTTTNFQVMSIPTVLFFKNGAVFEQIVGGVPFEVFRAKTESII